MKQSGRESGTSAAGSPLAPKNLGRPNGANTKAASPSTPGNAAAARNLGSPKDPHNENSSVSFWDSNSIPPWALGLVLFAGVLLAYQPAWHAGFIWDDDVYVTEKQTAHGPGRVASNLVLDRLSFAKLSIGLHHFSPRTRALGIEPRRVSLGQHPPPRKQRAIALATLAALKSPELWQPWYGSI